MALRDSLDIQQLEDSVNPCFYLSGNIFYQILWIYLFGTALVAISPKVRIASRKEGSNCSESIAGLFSHRS